MIGYVADLAFYYVPDMSGIVGLNWRLVSYICLSELSISCHGIISDTGEVSIAMLHQN